MENMQDQEGTQLLQSILAKEAEHPNEGLIDIVQRRRSERAGIPWVPYEQRSPEEQQYRLARISRGINAIALPLMAIAEAASKSPTGGQISQRALNRFNQSVESEGELAGLAEKAKLRGAMKGVSLPAGYKQLEPVKEYIGPKDLMDILMESAKAEARKRSGAEGFSGWRTRSDEWDTISAMPEGDDKEAAKLSYLYKWAPSSGYSASPAAVGQAAAKSGAQAAASTTARIGAEAKGAETTAETEAKVAKAKAAAGVEGKYAAAARGQYDLSGTEATALGKSVMSIDAMQTMANKIDAGDVGFFSLTPAGKFTNPEVRKLFQVINEYYARPLSGAAINATEWKQFKSEVLDKWDTLTPEARKVAAQRLRQLATADIQVGALATKDDGWLGRVRSAGIPQFDSEAAARAAGYKNGDKVQLLINGKYVTGTLR